MPTTPDEFAAALFVLIVLGALAIVGIGRLVVWVVGAVEQARGVKVSPPPAPRPARDYVAQPAPRVESDAFPPVGTGTGTGTGTDAGTREREPAAEETPYIRMTREQYEKLKARVWLEGAASAFGTLQGRGALAELERLEQLTEAKRAIFGTSNRRLTAANKLIAQAAAKAAPADDDLRLVPVDNGDGGYIDL